MNSFEQSAFALIGAILAGAGSWIAVQQMLIARHKINLDLFDRRYAIYIATENFMFSCLNKDDVPQEEIRSFYEAQRAAAFLFDRTTNEFLLELWKRSTKLRTYGPTRRQALAQSKRESYEDLCNDSKMWIANELNGLTTRFQKIINLSTIRPFVLKEVIPWDEVTRRAEKGGTNLIG